MSGHRAATRAVTLPLSLHSPWSAICAVPHRDEEGIMRGQRWMIAAASAATIALGVASAPAQAQVRVDPQPLPYYARIVTGTGDWSPVVFYRPAGCIPPTFNLLNFFDAP